MPAAAAKAEFLRAAIRPRHAGLGAIPRLDRRHGRGRMAGPACSRAIGAGRSNIQRPVNEVVGSALGLTMVVNIATVLFIHIVAIPIAHLFGDAAIFGRRLRRDAHRLYRRSPTPNFLLALDPAVLPQPLVRHLHRRHDGPAVRQRAHVDGQASVDRRASDRARHRHRPRRHGRA